MSDDKDPQRISEAADNCEVLRARLAKYEDADGNPLAALKQPSAGVDAAELRKVVTDALMGMIAAITSSTPPANEPPPPFIQSAIDRAVDRIASLNASRAKLAAPSVVPDGWRLVPIEPTQSMYESARTSAAGSMTEKSLMRSYWRNMLAAAPSPAPEHVENRTTGDKYRAELYDEVWQKARDMGYGNVTEALIALERLKAAPASDVVPVPRELPPFAQKVISKLERFEECASDDQGVDIGRHWLDLLTQLGLLNRVQRSPGLWEISQQGEDLLNGGRA